MQNDTSRNDHSPWKAAKAYNMQSLREILLTFIEYFQNRRM